MITNDNYFYEKMNIFYIIYLYILFCFYTVGGKTTIDLPKKSVHLTTTEPAELDSSNSCAVCRAFVTGFKKLLKLIFN